MSRKQIRIDITDAIVIPSLAVADMSENDRAESAALLRVKVFVEDPKHIVQLRIRKNVLVKAFRQVDFFNQERMKAYLINVSGSLDRREPLAPRYGDPYFSMLVESMEANQSPLNAIPDFIQRLVNVNPENPGATTETSVIQPISGRSDHVTLPTTEPPVLIPFVLPSQQIVLPPVLDEAQRRYMLRRRASEPLPSVAAIGSSPLSSLAEVAAAAPPLPSASPLPPTKRQQEKQPQSSRRSTASSSLETKESTVSRPIVQRPVPEIGEPSSSMAIHSQASISLPLTKRQQKQPESSSRAVASSSRETKESTVIRPIPQRPVPPVAEAFSSKAIPTRVSVSKKRSTKAGKTEDLKSSTTLTRPDQVRKRERETDQDQDEEEEEEEEEDDDKPVRRRARHTVPFAEDSGSSTSTRPEPVKKRARDTDQDQEEEQVEVEVEEQVEIEEDRHVRRSMRIRKQQWVGKHKKK